MPKGRRYTPEQIIIKLREAEVLQSQGRSVEEAARTLEIAPQTYYRWRKEYGDMNLGLMSNFFSGEVKEVFKDGGARYEKSLEGIVAI